MREKPRNSVTFGKKSVSAGLQTKKSENRENWQVCKYLKKAISKQFYEKLEIINTPLNRLFKRSRF